MARGGIKYTPVRTSNPISRVVQKTVTRKNSSSKTGSYLNLLRAAAGTRSGIVRQTSLAQNRMRDFDVLIIGSGLAGQTLALLLAEERRVGLVTKRGLLDSNSSWAHGGIAAVLADDDSVSEHIQDMLIAGAGLCD